MLSACKESIRKWAEEIRIAHTVFALPFALAAMAVAAHDTQGWPGWRIFLLILAALFTARTCAMIFNRLVDLPFDRLNPRTRNRHLVSGRLSIAGAVTLLVFNAFIFLAVCWFIKPICFYLAPFVLAVVCFYSLTKRFTDFTHVYLGVALGLSPIGAWLAVTGSLDFPPVILAFAVVFWLIGFDIVYATQDYEFDRSHQLHSLIVRWGVNNALQAALISHILMLLLLAAFGLTLRLYFGYLCLGYLIGLLIIAVCLLFEHWLARKRSRRWLETSFFRLNALISLVFLVVTVAEVAIPFFQRS